LIFLAIAWNVTGRSALVALDSRLAAWLHNHTDGALTAFFFALTNLHSPGAIAGASAIFGVALARLRQWYWLLTLAVAVGGGMLINLVLKAAYERLRPHFDDPLLVLTTFSFPSGHAAGAVLFYGVLAAFLVSRFYDWRARPASVAGPGAAAALLLLLPAWIFPIAAGAIFGFLWGIVAALLAVAASAIVGLLVARYVVRGRMERVARRNDVFKAVDRAVVKQPRKIVALLRMAPVIPCGLKSYFLGLTRVRLDDYMAGTLAGVAPDLLVKVYLGAAGRGALVHGGALNWALLG